MGAAKIRTPLLLLNFKTYPQASGKNALRLARIAASVAREAGASIAVAPPTLDLAEVAAASKVPVFAQHTDPFLAGQHTGRVPPDTVRALGAVGTLLNHSERRLHAPTLEACRAAAGQAGLATVVCAGEVSQARRVAALRPEFVAIEPPDLIGGNVSVSTARPSVVSRGVEAVVRASPRTKVLCGAGVKTREDVRRAIELGTDGVLLASGVTLARYPRAALRALVDGLP